MSADPVLEQAYSNVVVTTLRKFALQPFLRPRFAVLASGRDLKGLLDLRYEMRADARYRSTVWWYFDLVSSLNTVCIILNQIEKDGANDQTTSPP
jgi:hypothetical protein